MVPAYKHMYKERGGKACVWLKLDTFASKLHYYKLSYTIIFTFAEESFTSTAVQVHIALQTTFIQY